MRLSHYCLGQAQGLPLQAYTTKNMRSVLAVDDDPAVLETFKAILDDDLRVLTAPSGADALDILRQESVHVVFLDLRLPGEDGIGILRAIKALNAGISVIMVSAVDSARSAVDALNAGAYHYVTKPFDPQEIRGFVRRASVTPASGAAEKPAAPPADGCARIIGTSPQARDLCAFIRKIAPSCATVLISGESGTGKELVASALHLESGRASRPFVPINCASIPENLLESELFGYEKGAFTGAAGQKLGMLELAHEGTILLDEISELRPQMQAKLLRALDAREIKRVGGTRNIKIDVRIIAATNADLARAVQEGRFRSDLFYRLNVVPVHLPPLRERRQDIPLLLRHFLAFFNRIFRKNIEGFSPEAEACLARYAWPGNIRELKNIVERLAALKDAGTILPQDLPLEIFTAAPRGDSAREGAFRAAVCDFQRQYIERMLERSGGNKVKAARMMGIHRNALFSKMKSLGLKT